MGLLWKHFRPAFMNQHGETIPTRCILLPGNDPSKKGYRRIADGLRMVYIHRIIMAQVLGRDITENEVVRHMCNDGRCINPHHLEIGTQADNVQDMHKAGRAKQGHVPGVKHGMATISEEQAKQIIGLLPTGKTAREIAGIVGCTISPVQNIMGGRGWKHLPRVLA